MSWYHYFIISMILGLFVSGCHTSDDNPANPTNGINYIQIPLSGIAAQSNAEFSGLAWYGDKLVLMPENPESFSDFHFFSITKSAIDSFLVNPKSGSPHISTIQLKGDFSSIIPGFEGFESIIFQGDRAYLTIEAHNDTRMTGWLVSGQMSADGNSLVLDTHLYSPIPVPGNIPNYASEAITIYKGELVTFYEANGKNVNNAPMAYRFDTGLNYMGNFPFPHIEYRITDASAVDSSGRFWLMNYYYPGEKRKLNPADDIFAANKATSTDHTVERLIHMKFKDNQIMVADSSTLEMASSIKNGNNWEGVARLGNKGFLVITDEYPETILAFIPFKAR